MSEEHPSKPCPHCQGGRKHFCTVTLMTWLGDDLITVPNFPAWVCDMCGHRNYDTEALAQLSLLLNPEAGVPIQFITQPPEKPSSATRQPRA